jgi:hypothetical protein
MIGGLWKRNKYLVRIFTELFVLKKSTSDENIFKIIENRRINRQNTNVKSS